LNSGAALSLPEKAPSARPRALAVGLSPAFTTFPSLRELLDLRPAPVEEATQGLRSGGLDAILLGGDLAPEVLSRLLETAGPNGIPGRPVVLVLSENGRRTNVETRYVDHVDDFVNGERGEEALLARLRNALRVRATLTELQRKNEELQGLYSRLEGMARRMAEELRLAGNLQRSLLPTPLNHPRLDLAREFMPMREIGGDYLDVLPLGASRLALVLGDVMGKGVPAALLAANLKACLHAQLQAGDAPAAELVSRVNRLFWEVTPKGLFASLFFSVLDFERGVIRYVNAGHDHPFIVRTDGRVEDLVAGGTVLGLIENGRYEEAESAFGPGDRVVLYSDGVTDREDATGQPFGVERLKAAALASRRDPARIALYSLLGEIQGWAAGKDAGDDLTLVVARAT
jgi:sigma-B regulation protein RsbU (phosphoserine phosphatase)